MLIVEGPDGGGKTTLKEWLKEQLPLIEIPRAVDSDQKFLQPVDVFAEDAIRRGFGPWIYDRFCLISEPIYGPTCRGRVQPRFETDWYGHAWAHFRALEPIVVLCLPPLSVAVRNMQVPGQPEIIKGKEQELWLHYHTLYQRNRSWFCFWDYTLPNLEDRRNWLLQDVRAQLERKGQA